MMRKRCHIVGGLAVLFGLTLMAQAATPSSVRGRVSRVVDGDTIVVESVGTVRLIGIDSPEVKDPRRPVERFGVEASNQMTSLALGQVVRLEFEGQRTDVYGRTLAYVYLEDDRMLNIEMIRHGYAHAYLSYPFSKMDDFRAWQRDAQRDARGLWSTAAGTAPHATQGQVQPVAARLTEPAEVLVDLGPRMTGLYHRDTCPWVRGATTTHRLPSPDAKTRYFQPHCACVYGHDEHPCTSGTVPAVASPAIAVASPPAGTAAPVSQRAVPAAPRPAVSSGRCQATTRKGSQCSRSAQPGRNYCWQH